MYILKITKQNGMVAREDFATEQEAQERITQLIENKDFIKQFGKPERWLPDYLEGVETRQVEIQPAVEAYTYMEQDHDEQGNPVGEPYEVSVEATEAEYVTEYLHPAEYTYEIIAIPLEEIKAQKLRELSQESLSSRKATAYGEDYRIANIVLGLYDEATIAKIKKVHEDHRNSFYVKKAEIEGKSDIKEIKETKFEIVKAK